MQITEMKTKLIFILLMVLSTVLSEDNAYCKLETCPNRSHTLCQYQEFGLGFGPGCMSRNRYASEIPDQSKDFIVDAHNNYRKGRMRQRYNLPDLTDFVTIPWMEWDNELETAAQVWAYQCESIPDICRNVDRFNVTQRVAVKETSIPDSIFAYSYSIKDWFEEERERLLNIPSSGLGEPSSSTSHQFINLAWTNTNRIGCGITQFKENEIVTSFFVCNYGYMKPEQE